MVTLAEKHPAVYQEFLHGNFTVNKTGRPFSNIAIDQAHEQHNARVRVMEVLLASHRTQLPSDDGWCQDLR